MTNSGTKRTRTAKSAKKAPARKASKVISKRQPSPKEVSSAKRYDDDMADAFIQEVTEDVKNDNLKIFWNKYGIFIILFVVLAVCGAVSFETIKNWREKQYQSQTENYLKAFETGNSYETSLHALEKIAAGDNGIYSDLARIQIANILFEQNKINEGQEMLEVIIGNEEINPRIRNLAALKLATYKIDSAPREEIWSLLQPIAEADNSWSPLAKDMLAMAAIRDGDIAEAKKIYTSLLEYGNISESFKSRIQDMLAALNGM